MTDDRRARVAAAIAAFDSTQQAATPARGGGRPSAPVIAEHVSASYVVTHVLEADALYAICYDNQPIGLRKTHALIDTNAKYPRIAHANPAHAIRMAKKLNALFKTDRFTVRALLPATKAAD